MWKALQWVRTVGWSSWLWLHCNVYDTHVENSLYSFISSHSLIFFSMSVLSRTLSEIRLRAVDDGKARCGALKTKKTGNICEWSSRTEWKTFQAVSQISLLPSKVCTCLLPFTDLKENGWYRNMVETPSSPCLHHSNAFPFVGGHSSGGSRDYWDAAMGFCVLQFVCVVVALCRVQMLVGTLTFTTCWFVARVWLKSVSESYISEFPSSN